MKYSLDSNDYLTFQLYTASQSKSIAGKRRLKRIVFPISYLIFSIVFFNMDDYILTSIALIVAVLWFVIYPFYSRRIYVRHYNKHIAEYNQQRISIPGETTIVDDSLIVVSDKAESKMALSELKGIIELRDHFLLQIDAGSAVILPKGKIDKTELDSFVEELEKSIGLSRLDKTDWVWK